MYVGFAGAAGPSANADELTPWRSKTPRSPDCCTGRGFFLHGFIRLRAVKDSKLNDPQLG